MTTTKPQLWEPFQGVGVKFLAERDAALLLDPPGVGKTVMGTVAAQRVKPSTVLILSKRSKMWEWGDEIEKWTDERPQIVDVTGQERVDQVTEFLSRGGWLIMNHHSVIGAPHPTRRRAISRPKRQRYYLDALLSSIIWDVIIVDEIHHFRNGDAQMVQGLWRIPARHKWGLTATSIDGTPLDLWAALRWLFPTKYRAYWGFAHKYAHFKSNGFSNFIYDKPKNLPELHREIAPFTLKRTEDEAGIVLPKTVEVTRWLELTPKERSLYKMMEREMIVEYGGKTVAAPIAVAQLTRLRQLAVSPTLLFSDKRLPLSTKFEAALDIIEDRPREHKVVVASQFRTAVEQLAGIMDTRYPHIPYSMLTGKSKGWNIVEREMRENSEVLLMTTATGGEAINLDMCHTLIVLDLPWSSIDWTQLKRRIVRGSSKFKRVRTIHLMVKDTIDEEMWGVLSRKNITNDQVLPRHIWEKMMRHAHK